jgi:dTDP-4-amino-4,6-dideoxy-D-galactose acyltransferase
MSELVFLSWDSIFFEKNIAKIHIDEKDFNQINDTINLIRSSNFDLVYVFSKKTISSEVIELLSKNNIILFDKKITYSLNLDEIIPLSNNETISIWDNEFNDEILEILLESGKYSRFKLDERLNPYFEKMYIVWLQKSINKEIADITFSIKVDNHIAGFVTLKKKNLQANIGLIGISSKYQNKGLGSKLMNQVFTWCKENGITSCEVVTQKDNAIACKFYEKNKFKQLNEQFIFHYHK